VGFSFAARSLLLSHLALVDVVHLERLEHLRLDEVSDADLGHDGDGDGLLDLEDHLRVGRARDAARGADFGGDALEGHHGDGAGLLGDTRLLNVADVCGGGVRGREG
jgi:hypothetical protein